MERNNERELAWAGGLFDGEGSIFATTPKARPRYVKLNMAVSMTEREPVQRFATAVGVGEVKQLNRKTVKNKTVYRWKVESVAQVRQAFEAIEPYLCQPKRDQAKRALDARKEYEKMYMPENYTTAAKQRWETRRAV